MRDTSLLFDPFSEVEVHQRNMPHWRQQDSIAKEKRDELLRVRESLNRAFVDPARTNLTEVHQRRSEQLFQERIQHWLDAGSGSCVLRYPEAKRIMRETLLHFDGKRYHLGSFAVAGNHVHVLVAPIFGFELSGILHSWKSYSANAINRALGRKGALWQDESYDHLVRSEASLARITAYILAHEEQGALVERRSF
ncbi:MAG: transposase [Flavobacteriales bacterium]